MCPTAEHSDLLVHSYGERHFPPSITQCALVRLRLPQSCLFFSFYPKSMRWRFLIWGGSALFHSRATHGPFHLMHSYFPPNFEKTTRAAQVVLGRAGTRDPDSSQVQMSPAPGVTTPKPPVCATSTPCSVTPAHAEAEAVQLSMIAPVCRLEADWKWRRCARSVLGSWVNPCVTRLGIRKGGKGAYAYPRS